MKLEPYHTSHLIAGHPILSRNQEQEAKRRAREQDFVDGPVTDRETSRVRTSAGSEVRVYEQARKLFEATENERVSGRASKITDL